MNHFKHKPTACFSVVLFAIFVGLSQQNFSQGVERSLKSGSPSYQLSGIYSSKNPTQFYSDKENQEEIFFPAQFPLDKKSCTEDIGKRTLKSRTFYSNDGQVVVQNSYSNINYYDKENKLQVISAKLKSTSTCWAATHQQFPLFLNQDGSSEITTTTSRLKFNLNCKINNLEINNSDFTVGEDGMILKNVAPNIDKKIIFTENRIESDYIIRQHLNSNSDIIFSEEIQLPEGYTIEKEKFSGEFISLEQKKNAEENFDEYIVRFNNTVQARFKTPLFYDAAKIAVNGKYNFIKVGNNYLLEVVVPGNWLNDSNRKFPVTIDPIVIGPDTMYPPIYFGTCVMPNFHSDSILITIPANITIVQFVVTDSYFADMTQPGISMNDGFISLSSPCGSTPVYSVGGSIGDTAGYAYLDSADLKGYLSCCFSPSCSIQQFYLAHHLARSSWLGTGCAYMAGVPPWDYVYYSPMTPWPFNAFIVGRTVETTNPQWTLIPNTVCEDSCHVKLRTVTNYGVPPYTITHPWFVGSSTYGASVGSCNSTGIDTILITIPGCPTYCNANSILSVPPPNIVDVCGNVVTGLTNKNLTLKGVPDASALSVSACIGTPINITLTSCLPTTTYAWTGSNGTSGTGNITGGAVATATVITYTVVPTANGCIGNDTIVTATINSAPTLIITNPTGVCAPLTVDITLALVTAGSTAGTTLSYWNNSTATSPLLNANAISTSGTYYIQSSNGSCSVIQPVLVSINITPVLLTNNITVCLPNTADLTDAAITSGSTGNGNLTYWTNAGATIPLNNPSTVSIAGTYYIQSSNGNCSDIAPVVVTVNGGANVNIINNDTIIQIGSSVQLNAIGCANYSWIPVSNLNCSTCSNPIATPQNSTTYTVTGTDINGCTATDVVTINVLEGEEELYIPNCITPNHDNMNDIFLAYGVGIKQLTMQIFNRWGELIFETDELNKGWNGKYKDGSVQDDVYVYLIKCEWNSGKKVVRRGSVTIVH